MREELSNILGPEPTLKQVREILNVEPDCDHGYEKEASLIYCAHCASNLLGLALAQLEEKA